MDSNAEITTSNRSITPSTEILRLISQKALDDA